MYLLVSFECGGNIFFICLHSMNMYRICIGLQISTLGIMKILHFIGKKDRKAFLLMRRDNKMITSLQSLYSSFAGPREPST